MVPKQILTKQIVLTYVKSGTTFLVKWIHSSFSKKEQDKNVDSCSQDNFDSILAKNG